MSGFFHPRSMPGAVWPPIPAADARETWAAYLELDRTQWLSAADIEAHQLRQLRALLQHCFDEIPYYRRLLSDIGFPKKPVRTLDDLRRLPILTREIYQQHFKDLQASSLPSGMAPIASSFTSGTNGVPLKVLHTNRTAMWWNALHLRDLEWCGFDPKGRLAAIRLVAMNKEDLPAALAGHALSSWHPALDAVVETGPCYLMDIRQDPVRQLAWLQRIRPDYLLSMPSNLEALAARVADGGSRWPELRAIQTMGEPLSPAARSTIEGAFDVPVKNVYSTTEAGYIASQCPDGGGLHVHHENVIAEVLDADGHPCRSGETGRLVFTTLHNFLTPFLRYEILDDVTLGDAACACGRGLTIWTHVEGRRHLAVHLPDGRLKSSMGITLGLRKVGGCRQFQIVQRAVDRVVVRVVPDITWTPAHAERMQQVVRQEFEADVQVNIEERPFLERTAGGKLRVVEIQMADC